MEVNFVARWRPDAEDKYKADVQKVAEEIYSLGDKPEVDEVLDMARNKDTEIHKLIEWNDDIAAEKYRKTQVRHIIRDIEVTYISPDKTNHQKLEVPVRMFYNLKGETGYRPTSVIIRNEDLHMKLLRTAQSELEAYMNKYRVLTEMKPLIEEIDRLVYELKIFDKVS